MSKKRNPEKGKKQKEKARATVTSALSAVFEENGENGSTEPLPAEAGSETDEGERPEKAKNEKSGEQERLMEEMRRTLLAEAEKEADALFADAGMVNPYTDEPIRTKQDFLAWKEQYLRDSENAVAERLGSYGLSEEDVRDLLAGTGEEDAPAEADISPEYAPEAEGFTVPESVEAELAKIRQWEPSVASLEDLTAGDAFGDLYDKVLRGYSLSDAFYLANAEKIRRTAEEKAEQALRNRLLGKEHLASTTARGEGENPVPPEIMKEFKRLLPNAQSDDIRRFYRRDQAKLKR